MHLTQIGPLRRNSAYCGVKRVEGGQSERGFASMDEKKQRDIASKGGQPQGKENNPGNFANDREKASEAGKKGGQS